MFKTEHVITAFLIDVAVIIVALAIMTLDRIILCRKRLCAIVTKVHRKLHSDKEIHHGN